MSVKVINLEDGYPTVEYAKANLIQQIRTAKSNHVAVLKIIHGYGSNGKGGAIKVGIHKLLDRKQKAGEIKGFVKGEEFSPFYESARVITDKQFELTKDRDYSQTNHGITIVLL